jgi:hypothetical protein
MTTKEHQRRTIGAHSWVALAIAVAITLAGGALYGNYSQRWSPPVELTAAAAQLEQFPQVVGSWKASEDLPIEKYAVDMLECKGYVHRRYVDQDSGQAVQLAFLVGPPGPIAVHTPEICFSSRAYEMAGERTETTFDGFTGKRNSFWRVDFTSRNALADGLRVYYAWSSGRTWSASRSPRFEFAGAPLLYKIQLAAYFVPRVNEETPDPGRQFLEELLRTWSPGESPSDSNS